MAEEVDQASIDVIKTLFESENGKKFFGNYLKENLEISINNSVTRVDINIMFNGLLLKNIHIISSTVSVNNY